MEYYVVIGLFFAVLFTVLVQIEIDAEAPEVGEYYDEKIKNACKKFGKAVKNHYSR